MNYVGSSRAKRGGGWKKWVLALAVLAAIGGGAWFFYPEISPAIQGALGKSQPSAPDDVPDVLDMDAPPDIEDDAASATVSADQAREDEIRMALAEAKELDGEDRVLEARQKLLELMKDPKELGASRAAVEEFLGEVNVALVMTPRTMPGKVVYSVEEGDTLGKIVDKFVCPKLHIMKMNNIQDENKIHPGDVLRVLDRPKYDITISKTDNTLVLTLNGEFFRRYKVGTGEFGKTPVGTFVIDDKIENPPWWKDGKAIPFGDKDNILGTRWMRISATGDTTPVSGYGIHGTWDNSTLGKQSSAGCIRMNNADVEEVFMLVPRGTTVTITE